MFYIKFPHCTYLPIDLSNCNKPLLATIATNLFARESFVLQTEKTLLIDTLSHLNEEISLFVNK